MDLLVLYLVSARKWNYDFFSYRHRFIGCRLSDLRVNGVSMQDFKKLQVWKMSHDLTLRIYDVTSGFLREEIYGLTSQIRRACASIPANIAEGWGQIVLLTWHVFFR